MALTDSLGIDIGTHIDARDRLLMAAEAGARLARVRFALGGEQALVGRVLDEAAATTRAASDAGVRVLAVVDGDLTVAPGGARAFEADGMEDLAEAWRDELVSNVTALAEVIGGDVRAWEILPDANVGKPEDVTPERFAALLGAVGAAIGQAAPGAVVIAGGLVSDDEDDAVDYLQAVYKAGAWEPGSAPFDGIGIRLKVAQDAAQSEEAVAAALTERTRRLWRVVENTEGHEAASEAGVYVTGVSWDADDCGEEVQGRNAWTALDALTADPAVRAVVWTSLVDADDGATGLCRALTEDPDDRRPAWQAFKDFSVYLSQISPADTMDYEAAGSGDETVEIPVVIGAAGAAAASVTAAGGGEAAQPGGTAAAETGVGSLTGSAAAAAAVMGAATSDDDEPAGPGAVRFSIPTAEEVLSGMGLDQAQRDKVLAAVTAKYGGHEWLPPGSYEVSVEMPAAPVEAPAPYTNQQVISAMYRVGGGTWSVLERSGLQLAELAARRDEPYRGPRVGDLVGLTDDERAQVESELEGAAPS